jgi:hypothetical protein
MDTLTSWWLSLRSNANSLFNNEFDDGLPHMDPKLGYIPWPHTSLKIASINNGMFQTRGAVGSTRMKGQTLAQVFENVQNVVAVQIYPSDPATDPGQTTIINFNKSVGL